jgi:polysaccharide pyruvyl transferase WcaK-like protein
MTVFLAGAFGQGNPGDEALLSAFARELGHLDPVASTSDPQATAATHGVTAVERDDMPRVGREIARADAVVVAGGTIFKTLHPSCGRAPLSLLRRTAALAAATRALRKPLALVGVGAAPLRGRAARSLTRRIIRSANLLILRDEESAGHLAAAGAPTPIRVGADAAWTLVPEQRAEPAALADAAATPDGPAVLMRSATGAHAPVALDGAGDGRPVVVALSHLAGGPELAERLAAGLRPVVDAGLPVRLDPWQPDGDAELAAAVATRLDDPRVSVAAPPADLDEARESMDGARLVLAQRFHALVAAAGAGVPALAVAHEPKLEGLARRLEQPAVAADAPPATLAGEVLRAVDGPPAPPAAIERERASAAEAFRLLRVLLARGRSDEAVDIDGLALRPEEWLG